MNKERNSKFDLLAVLLLLCVFSVAILSLLLTGARSYKGLTESSQAAAEMQTESLYISNRIFQAESKARLEIESYGDVQCLCAYETVGDEEYVTRVYCHDGWIKELYSSADMDFLPEAGEKIMKADGLSFELEYNSSGLGYLLWTEISSDGQTRRMPYAWKGAYYGYEK